MKYFFAFFFIISFSLGFSQVNLSVINFQIADAGINPYIKKLGLTDENALIVRFRVTNAWVMEPTENYLVLLPDGRMFKYAAKNVY